VQQVNSVERVLVRQAKQTEAQNRQKQKERAHAQAAQQEEEFALLAPKIQSGIARLRDAANESGWRGSKRINRRGGILGPSRFIYAVPTGAEIYYSEGGVHAEVMLATDGKLYLWNNFHFYRKIDLRIEPMHLIRKLAEVLPQ